MLINSDWKDLFQMLFMPSLRVNIYDRDFSIQNSTMMSFRSSIKNLKQFIHEYN